jgi:hypothetical protein
VWAYERVCKANDAKREEITKLRKALECLKIDGRHLFVRERTGDLDMPYQFVSYASLLCGETISLLTKALEESDGPDKVKS